jgi:hypothetical protein
MAISTMTVFKTSRSTSISTNRRDSLVAATVFFLIANLIHTADHVRQGFGGVTTEVLVGGSALTLSAVLALVLVLRHNGYAAPFAAMLGVAAAIGITASHIAPHWSALSDSYPEIHADALSWAVMLLEVGAAILLAAVALREVRGEIRDRHAPRTATT